MYDNRDNLLRTLHDNETVVAQVEIAIGILFFIVWMFVTAAIYNADAVQRTWTALSAGLLSFSFIFGNSIREVSPLCSQFSITLFTCSFVAVCCYLIYHLHDVLNVRAPC